MAIQWSTFLDVLLTLDFQVPSFLQDISQTSKS